MSPGLGVRIDTAAGSGKRPLFRSGSAIIGMPWSSLLNQLNGSFCWKFAAIVSGYAPRIGRVHGSGL